MANINESGYDAADKIEEISGNSPESEKHENCIEVPETEPLVKSIHTTAHKSSKRQNSTIGKIVGISMFIAIAFVLSIATAWIKVSGFLSFDLKDSIIAMGAFVYGPVAAIPMVIITSLLEFITMGSTGPIGLLMDVISGLAFSLTASLVYKYMRSIKGAMVGFAAATIAYAAVMSPLNLWLTPIYMKVPRETVAEMIVPLLLPFNFAKGLINSAFSLIVYKPISSALSIAGLTEKKNTKLEFSRVTAITLAVAIAAAATGIIIFVLIN